jgi:hypothetical protein
VSDRDREKIPFSELDKRQRERRSGGGGGGGGGGSNGGGGGGGRRNGRSGRRERWASETYKRRVDEQLFGNRRDAARLRMQERMRAAQGSPAFLRTYREYVRDYGMPDDLQTLMLLLDLDDERESLKVMQAIEATVESVTPEQKSLLRGRLRNLEMSASSDALADAAVDLLGRL